MRTKTLKQTPENFKVFGDRLYENAKHPLYSSRTQEYNAAREYCRMKWGYNLTESDFDNIIAEKFGGGCELDWPRP